MSLGLFAVLKAVDAKVMTVMCAVRTTPMPVAMPIHYDLDNSMHKRARASVYCVLHSSGRHMTRIFI